VKRVILVVMVLITSICTTAYVRQETLLGEETAGHNKHAEDLTAAAQIKTFPPADNKVPNTYAPSSRPIFCLFMCAKVTTNYSRMSLLPTP